MGKGMNFWLRLREWKYASQVKGEKGSPMHIHFVLGITEVLETKIVLMAKVTLEATECENDS